MNKTQLLDGNTLKRILIGGAGEIRSQVDTINDLNVFPVPDGDTGTNMARTIESGIAQISEQSDAGVGEVASRFAKGSLLGARGNSGVILSQFFAGIGSALAEKETVSAKEFAEAYLEGVHRAYAAVMKPVEGTMLTVFRESVQYALDRLGEDSTIEDFFALTIEEARRSLARTKEILPPLAEADVVDSGGAGYLCIATGMYDTLTDKKTVTDYKLPAEDSAPAVDYDLFTSSSVLEFGYCTECLVRLMQSKVDIASFDEKLVAAELEAADCNSVVLLKDGDILKLHAHSMTPSVILAIAQKYGEFLNVKIENMSLQHSERESVGATAPKKRKHKHYGVVAVASGEGMTELFKSLGADVIINGGQTGNPSAEEFLDAFGELDADNILVFPNNGNILLTAKQAAELYSDSAVTVIPTKTLPEGYSALSVFNSAITDLGEQISDLVSAKEAVVSGEITYAVRDTSVNGIAVKEGDIIGIMNGELITARKTVIDALVDMISKIEDLDCREILTLFVGKGVSEEERAEVTEALEERFEDLSIEVFIGDQEVYSYLIAVE